MSANNALHERVVTTLRDQWGQSVPTVNFAKVG